MPSSYFPTLRRTCLPRIYSASHGYCSMHRVSSSTLLPVNSVADLVGGTQLARLNRIPQSLEVKATVFAKLEYCSPGGSVKDRIAKRMIEQAEHNSDIKPGDTLIEASKRVPAALCARVVRTSAGVPIDSPGSIISVAKRLQEQIPRAYILDQYNNPNTPAAYEFGTAGKIWRQTDGRVDVVITRAGTGGTVTRISRGLKRRSGGEPESLNNVKVEYKVEGIGYDFVPSVLDKNAADDWIKTGDHESFEFARRLVREEGFVLTSLRPDLVDEGKTVVIVLPDGLRNYLTKFADDDSMAQHVRD
ncbi:tryptophan synthase beta subunit-like PLP-dependent enzyme, partial [Lepidopterella palustris CBS 459.81]